MYRAIFSFWEISWFVSLLYNHWSLNTVQFKGYVFFIHLEQRELLFIYWSFQLTFWYGTYCTSRRSTLQTLGFIPFLFRLLINKELKGIASSRRRRSARQYCTYEYTDCIWKNPFSLLKWESGVKAQIISTHARTVKSDKRRAQAAALSPRSILAITPCVSDVSASMCVRVRAAAAVVDGFKGFRTHTDFLFC